MSSPVSKTWFASLENLLQDGGASLRTADSPILDTDQCISAYSPLTISLESFCISKQLDKKVNGNDLLVRTWTVYGQEPPVEVVHFFEKNVALGEPRDNLAVEHMFASESYLNQHIELVCQILEVDGTDSLAQEIQTAAHFLGAVFPAILPFTSITSNLYKSLKSVFKETHDLAFYRSLKLNAKNLIEHPNTLIPLRSGAYILFDQEVEGSQYLLRELKLEAIATHHHQLPDSYIVLKIVPKIINSLNSEDLLANQRLATSLLQKDDNSFEIPTGLFSRNKSLSSPFMLLKRASQRAHLIEQLIEYKRLKKLDIKSLESSLTSKAKLEIEEKLMGLSRKIYEAFRNKDEDEN